MSQQFTKTAPDGGPPPIAQIAGVPGVIGATGFMTISLLSGGPASVIVWGYGSGGWFQIASFSLAGPGDSAGFVATSGSAPIYPPGSSFYAQPQKPPGVQQYVDPRTAAQLAKGNPAELQIAVAPTVPPNPQPIGQAFTSPVVFVQLVGGAGGTFQVD